MTPRSLSTFTAAAIAAGMLIGLLPATTHAAPPPSGTISCDVSAATADKDGFQFRPYIGTDPRNVRLKATNTTSTCDISNVVDGKAPIVGVKIKVSGKMPDATCTTFTSATAVEKGKVQLKWIGLNPSNHPMTVAVNNLKVVTSGYDSGSNAVILTTGPIEKGAFLGKSVTLHLGLDDLAGFQAACTTNNILGTVFGNTNPSTVVVE